MMSLVQRASVFSKCFVDSFGAVLHMQLFIDMVNMLPDSATEMESCSAISLYNNPLDNNCKYFIFPVSSMFLLVPFLFLYS